MSGTVIPSITSRQFASRLAATFPNGWAGSDAAQFGAMFALLSAFSQNLEHVLSRVQYTDLASRVNTATFPELDLIGEDFFGTSLQRPAGMTDVNYAALIINSLFKDAATRSAISDAIERLTGVAPRMLEPWNIFDTGVWGRTSYWNVDTPANPARWGGSNPWQGFIESVSPGTPLIGPNNPVYCWGSGPQGPYWNIPGYFFGVVPVSIGQSVTDVVNRLRAEGTTVWVKTLSTPPAGSITAPSAPILSPLTAATSTSLTATWSVPTVGSTPFNFLVQFRPTGTLPWQTGPSTTTTTAVITGLMPATGYDVEIVVSNGGSITATSAIVQATTISVAPAPAENLTATLVQATAITLSWTAPATGTPPFNYSVQYRVTGTLPFTTFPVGQATTVTVIGLQPQTEYDIQVLTTNI